MLTLSRKARIGFEILFFAIGLVLFWLVIRATGFSNILFQLRQAQLSAWPVFLIYPIVSLWDTAAWKLVFNPSWDEAIKIHELFVIRLAGEAVNNITPFLDIGGEPLKVYLVSKRFGVPASQAISAGLIAKTTLIASETVFILFGFGFFLFFIPLPYEWRIIFGITFFFLAVILALLFLIQIKSDMTRSFYSTEKSASGTLFRSIWPAGFWAALKLISFSGSWELRYPSTRLFSSKPRCNLSAWRAFSSPEISERRNRGWLFSRRCWAWEPRPGSPSAF
ncbi:MAG: flippase-like domain-containing protein [Candidatus Omnitrophica bacterium]|nr:flippase-like domain-containing protein [Candidatus Omnitrophota bacterium]